MPFIHWNRIGSELRIASELRAINVYFHTDQHDDEQRQRKLFFRFLVSKSLSLLLKHLTTPTETSLDRMIKYSTTTCTKNSVSGVRLLVLQRFSRIT